MQYTSEFKHSEDLKEWSLECPLVYGPVRSRRHGFSLGINLLPGGRKVCDFDCLYCQCGRSSRQIALDSFSGVPFLPLDEIEGTIDSRFKELESKKVLPDTIVFSGNGEPTLHPSFPKVCEVVRRSRDQYLPESRIGILTNGTRTLDPAVFEAIAELDWTSIKLDAGGLWLNRPILSYDLEKLIPVWRQIPVLTIQSFFNEGRLAQYSTTSGWALDTTDTKDSSTASAYLHFRPKARGQDDPEGVDCHTNPSRPPAGPGNRDSG